MSRLGGAFWFILVVASGMTNFLVKQTVQGLDEQLTAVKKKTVAEQKEIHELTADWTFLNQPELLADLNNRYVRLVPVAPRQVIASADAIPLRPTPPPPEPAPMVMLPPPPVQMPSAPLPAPIIAAVADQPAHVPAAAAVPVTSAVLSQPAPAPQPAPIVPVAASQPAHMPAAPAVPIVSQPVHAPPPAAPPHPPKPASLDGLFAQVTGDR
jgi:hypothetical protein